MSRSASSLASRRDREVLRADRRWLLVWTFAFVGSLVALFGAYTLYRVTGPHPQVAALVRGAKHHVRWLIPGLKRRPNAKTVGLAPDRVRYASVDPRRG